jgi:hypothetical protein
MNTCNGSTIRLRVPCQKAQGNENVLCHTRLLYGRSCRNRDVAVGEGTRDASYTVFGNVEAIWFLRRDGHQMKLSMTSAKKRNPIQSQLPRNRQAHFLKKFGVSGGVVQII